MYPVPAKLIVTWALVSLMAACGGGGGGGSNRDTGDGGLEPDLPDAPTPAGFTISGTVTASSSQAVDGDTNDPARAAVPNDTVQSAQPIPNPITLGGYVNQPGTGSPGRSQASGDAEDFFRVQLLAGQTLTLLVADFREADADLYLYDTQENVLDYSINTGEIETLVIPEDGTYAVNVSALQGATNYILAIGAGSEASRSKPHRPEIVPWELIVEYRQAGAQGEMPKPADLDQVLAMEQRAGGRGRGRLMALRKGKLSDRQMRRRLGGARTKGKHITDPTLQARWQTLMAIKSLRRDPAVQYAEPNYKVKASLAPDDEAFSFQWHYPLIDLPSAWDTTTGDDSVVVAVVDTGILSRHPDLTGQLVPGYDFIRDFANAGDGNGIDPDPEDPGNRSEPGASSFHGTHVAGTVAARGNNQLGVAGVAWSARVMPLRALGGSGSGTSYDVNQAIRFAAGLPNDSGTLPQQPADIINLSLGGAGFSQADQDLLAQVRASGIMVVAAAGNEALSLPAYPASYDGVISVSAVDSQRRLARYSNTGSSIDIAAPGGDNSIDLNGDGYPDGVLSTGSTGVGFAYTFLSGTSMATPHVAGVLALMKSVNPALTPPDMDALLARGDLTDDLGPVGRDNQYGHGLVNAQRAVLAAIEAGGSSPANDARLVASATTLNFGTATDSLVLELRNGGRGDLQVESLEAAPDWLAIAPQQTGNQGLGLYRVSVDRSALQDGTHSGSITARAGGDEIVIRVLLSVGRSGDAADVGLVYILLHDLEQDRTYDQVAAGSASGLYRYRFDQVPPGRYEIVAGSDADNDLFICDPGEACGSWLTIDQPIVLEPESNLEDLDFPIEYLVSIPNISGSIKHKVPGRARPRSGETIAKPN